MLQYEIIVDHGETPNKCTILPLAYRSDFRIFRPKDPKTLQAEVLLHPEGRCLSEWKQSSLASARLAAIDCVWRRLDPILDALSEQPPHRFKIPQGFVTAYPRVSKKDYDPEGGLATIEAIFIAAAFMGSWDLSLLREYFFADEFLRLNESLFRHYEIWGGIEGKVYDPSQAKNARTRRLGRGRMPKEEQALVQ